MQSLEAVRQPQNRCDIIVRYVLICYVVSSICLCPVCLVKSGLSKLYDKRHSNSGVGKVRPADAFCPARGIVNLTQASYFPCKNKTWSSNLLKRLGFSSNIRSNWSQSHARIDSCTQS